MDPLDEIDRQILTVLQEDGRLSGTDIGRRVNLSQPAVSARIQRLERSGVIKGYTAVVDPAKVGLNIHAVVRLRTTHARMPEALELFEKLDQVTATYRLTGEDCFLLDVHAPDAGAPSASRRHDRPTRRGQHFARTAGVSAETAALTEFEALGLECGAEALATLQTLDGAEAVGYSVDPACWGARRSRRRRSAVPRRLRRGAACGSSVVPLVVQHRLLAGAAV